ncbi:MAG: hypothetical protein JXR25_12875 [Pontiellaceae bacterium]|nr:hypothetical protein [Pontiellaceae bacterium]MBN2785709.1 hypothetical protein [Pontiellaceae bacterium]
MPGPSLDRIEAEGLAAIIGGNKLTVVKERLSGLPDDAWNAMEETQRRIVGKCFKREGELPWNDSGLLTTLHLSRRGYKRESDPGYMIYMIKIWNLYDLKMGMEDRFKDLLPDLAGHRPLC